MRPRYLVCITLLALCHLDGRAQVLTDGLPPAAQAAAGADGSLGGAQKDATLPDDPGEELLPVARPEPEPPSGVPVVWEARQQTQVGDTWTLVGDVTVHYRDYTLRADRVVYHQSTTVLEADGHLQVSGGPEDLEVEASHGDMRLDMHTARFYNVTGSLGVQRQGRTTVFSTPNPFLFSGRVLLETGEGQYRVIDGTMTNCKLPRPDWTLTSHLIRLDDETASASRTFFKFLGVPLFYLPYLQHPTNGTGRQSGFLIPMLSNSSIKGFVVGEQYYWAINRSMDMVVGSEYFSKRGFAPNGDFRYKGPGLDRMAVRWNALLDRGVAEPGETALVNQGGVDIYADGRKDLSTKTRVAGDMEYLSSYVYRLVFNDNYWQAVSSQVQSNVSVTHTRNGLIPSASLERFQTFANPTSGNEVRILHLPSLRFDAVDEPLRGTPLYWRLGSSVAFMGRSAPDFHARNVGRIDIYPRLSLPLSGNGWSVTPEAALRATYYSVSQIPNLTSSIGGTPTLSHESLDRHDAEVSVDLRPPAVERDFHMGLNREVRHVIEPELTYRLVKGIGPAARDVLQMDTTDTATDTNELGFSVTQRFYVRSEKELACTGETRTPCPGKPRQWASWQIAQKYYIDPNFGGALIPGRRNVFDSTLDLSGVAFLTDPRNLAPLISRLRFEAVHNLRIEWDMDYDPKDGRLSASNIYAGYSWGRTTVGMGHALLNAVDEAGSAASTIQSNQLQPFLTVGKPNGTGFNLAANGSYDFVHQALQYAGIQAVYNWNCCGLTFGYRRFSLGTVRDETQWLYSFTLANFGSVGDIRRVNTVFRDPDLPPAY